MLISIHTLPGTGERMSIINIQSHFLLKNKLKSVYNVSFYVCICVLSFAFAWSSHYVLMVRNSCLFIAFFSSSCSFLRAMYFKSLLGFVFTRLRRKSHCFSCIRNMLQSLHCLLFSSQGMKIPCPIIIVAL